MTDINGGSGANGLFELDSLGRGQSEESKHFSDVTDGVSLTSLFDQVGKSMQFVERPPEMPPFMVVAQIDTMPQPELEAIMTDHVARSDSDLATALYSTSPGPLTDEGLEAVQKFSMSKIDEMVTFAERALEKGIDSLEPADLEMIADTASLLSDIEVVQERLGLSETPFGKFIGIAAGTTKAISGAIGGMIADPVRGQSHLAEAAYVGQHMGVLLEDPTMQRLDNNYNIATNVEGYGDAIVVDIVKDAVYSDLGVPRMADGRFDTSQAPTAAEVNDHELMQDRSFIRLVDPDVDSKTRMMTTGVYDPDGLIRGPDLDFKLSDFIGLPADSDVEPDEVGSDEPTPVDDSVVVEDETDPIIPEGTEGFLDKDLDDSGSGEVDDETVADDETVVEEETVVGEETVTEDEEETVTEDELGSSAPRPMSLDFDQLEESASDLNAMFEQVLSVPDLGVDQDLLLDTPLMARFAGFVDDLDRTLKDVTYDEAIEIGGVVSTLAMELHEDMAELDAKGYADSPAYTAAAVLNDLLGSVFYASNIADGLMDPAKGAMIMSDIIQPVTQQLGDVFKEVFQTYAQTGEINGDLQAFLLEASVMANGLFNEVQGYYLDTIEGETDSSD